MPRRHRKTKTPNPEGVHVQKSDLSPATSPKEMEEIDGPKPVSKYANCTFTELTEMVKEEGRQDEPVLKGLLDAESKASKDLRHVRKQIKSTKQEIAIMEGVLAALTTTRHGMSEIHTNNSMEDVARLSIGQFSEMMSLMQLATNESRELVISASDPTATTKTNDTRNELTTSNPSKKGKGKGKTKVETH